MKSDRPSALKIGLKRGFGLPGVGMGSAMLGFGALTFETGIDIDSLSQKYRCTKSTIIRNLKKNLGELKYKELINKSKSFKEKSKTNKNQTNNLLKINSDNENVKKDYQDHQVLNSNITSSNFGPIDSFLEIAPVDYEIDNSSRKELSSVSLSEVDFPRVVYMVVDKKIELEIKLLKDFPEWQFLPASDLNRKSIQIFFDLNRALGKQLQQRWQHLDHLTDRAVFQQPGRKVVRKRDRLETAIHQLVQSAQYRVKMSQSQLEGAQEILTVLNPQNVLERGYSIAMTVPEREIIRSAHALGAGDPFQVQTARGKFSAVKTNDMEEK